MIEAYAQSLTISITCAVILTIIIYLALQFSPYCISGHKIYIYIYVFYHHSPWGLHLPPRFLLSGPCLGEAYSCFLHVESVFWTLFSTSAFWDLRLRSFTPTHSTQLQRPGSSKFNLMVLPGVCLLTKTSVFSWQTILCVGYWGCPHCHLGHPG
jgi:hypothetical protein